MHGSDEEVDDETLDIDSDEDINDQRYIHEEVIIHASV